MPIVGDSLGSSFNPVPHSSVRNQAFHDESALQGINYKTRATNSKTCFSADRPRSHLEGGPPARPALSVQAARRSSFFQVHQQIYLSLYDKKQTEQLAQHTVSGKYVVVPSVSGRGLDTDLSLKTIGFSPTSLVDIHKFNAMVDQIARQNRDSKLVFVAGADAQDQMRAVFLIGCHLMIAKGFDAEGAFQVFEKFDDLFVIEDGRTVCMMDCWRCFHHAVVIGWIDFGEHFDMNGPNEGAIDIEQFMHYSRFVLKAPRVHAATAIK